AVHEDRDRDDSAEVQHVLHERRNVPERVPDRDAGRRHQGSNDITGRIAAAAEYGSRVPATTSSKTAFTAPACTARSTRPAHAARRAAVITGGSAAGARPGGGGATAPLAARAARCGRTSASSSATPTSCRACIESTGVSQSTSRSGAVLE